MKYIIDDEQLNALDKEWDKPRPIKIFRDLTPVPELPVKPWSERSEWFDGSTSRIENMQAEITELRALCLAQDARIEEFEGKRLSRDKIEEIAKRHNYGCSNKLRDFVHSISWELTGPSQVSSKKNDSSQPQQP